LAGLNEISSEASFKENLCWPGEGWPKVSKEKDAERREAHGPPIQRFLSWRTRRLPAKDQESFGPEEIFIAAKKEQEFHEKWKTC